MDIISSAIETFKNEAQAILDLEKHLTDDFVNAVNTVKDCKGRLIITGIGKSGLIGSKIASTLSSTGTPAYFIHPVEAIHGDLGMITKNDIVIAISNSGKTDEVLRIIPYLEANKIPLIAITNKPGSLLAKHANFNFFLGVENEACPLNLAPTTTSTATLAFGDAFAIALMRVRNFKEEDFARFHPGGNLGSRLLTQAKDLMHKKKLPIVPPTINVDELILEISKAKLGLAIIFAEGKIAGIVTDGDVRRAMQKFKKEAFDLTAADIMTKKPITILDTTKIIEAEQIMKSKSIHSILVVNEQQELVGVLDYFNSVL